MLWSIPIGTIAGTVVRIHVTFLIFLVWIGAAQWRVGGRDAAIEGVVFIVLIFACVLAHEFGHIFAARRYGIGTPEVTLWPIGGVASLERIPEKPSEELVVALAGPAVNVVIAAVLLLFLGLSLDGAAMTELENPRASLLARVAAANIFLVVFNLIPAFPMDGGRVLRALLAMRPRRGDPGRRAHRPGRAFLFALAGLFVNPMLIVIGLFVYLAATAEAQHVAFRDGTQGLSVRDAMITPVETLRPGATLGDAVDLLLSTAQKEFPFVDSDGRPRGLLTRDALIEALRDSGAAAPILDAMVREIPSLPASRPLDYVVPVAMPGEIPSLPASRPLEAGLATLNRAKAPALFVLDQAGRLAGLMTPENIGEMMLVRSVRPDFRFRRLRSAA